MSEAELAPTTVTAPRVAATLAKTAVKRRSSKPKLKDTWWRHVVAIIAIVIALFPVVYIVSSAFNAHNTLQSAQVIPTHVTLHNFGDLLHNNVSANTGAKQDVPYPHWFLNSMIIASLTALSTTMLGALAAYAFSRFRFKGRRVGMLVLLLIQMFPQFVAVAAIYLIVLNIGDVFPQIGLEQAGGARHRLPRRRDGRAGVADEGLLRHDPDGARRVRARRRRDRRRRSSGASCCRSPRPCSPSSR